MSDLLRQADRAAPVDAMTARDANAGTSYRRVAWSIAWAMTSSRTDEATAMIMRMVISHARTHTPAPLRDDRTRRDLGLPEAKAESVECRVRYSRRERRAPSAERGVAQVVLNLTTL